MIDDEAIVMVGLILLAMKSNTNRIAWGDGWAWPIPAIDLTRETLEPVISQEFRPGGARPHYGVDLMYRRAGTFFVPALPVPVVAARDGVLWSIALSPRGWSVVIDHGPPFATYYQHLESIADRLREAPRGTPIARGEPLGVMGTDPLDSGHVRHLHFAIWYQGHGDVASVDPGRAMPRWQRPHWRPDIIQDG